jgi:hypothetical protein
MSIGGPSALGTLLVQRLDATLGVTLSQQTNIASGARPDAVAQPDRPQRPDAVQNDILRHPRESVERASLQTEQHVRQAIDKTKIDAGKALLSGRSAPATTSTASAPTTLGAAARAILALLASYPDQAPAIAGKAPLAFPDRAAAPTGTTAPPAVSTQMTTASPAAGPLAGPAPAQAAIPSTAPPLGSLIAQGLAQALQQSGLFYESHLSNLAFGKQSAAALMTEPQALLGRGPESAANASNSQAPAGNEPTSPAPTSPSAEAGSSSRLLQTAAAPSTPSSAGPLAGLHPETHLLVRQQLEVLANQAIAWRGEAWPDAPLEWDIQRRQEAPDGSNSPEQDHWATRLKITLPHLGEVQARLSLVNQQVVMHLVAPEAAEILTANGEQLRTRFLASGLQLSQLSFSAQSPESPASATDIEGEA